MPIPRILAQLRSRFLGIFSGAAEASPERPPRLWSCPNSTPALESREIGPAGGELPFGNHVLEVPAGALRENVTIRGEDLGDADHLKVELTVDGQDAFTFERPVSLTLSYASCSGPGNSPHLILKIDPRTNGVIEVIRGRPDPQRRTVTASITRFSTYTLGFD